MNINTQKLGEYAVFLDENSANITALCNEMGELLTIAVQCMDQQSGKQAALRMANNLENIKKSVPVSADVSERLALAKKMIDDIVTNFGRR